MRRLGQEEGIYRRRDRRPGGSRCLRPVFDDLVLREFTDDAPGRLWVADTTQRWTLEGWLYLAVAIDIFSRPVVGWVMAERMTTERVVSALEMAVHDRRPDPGVTHHSDQGPRHTPLLFGKHLAKRGVLGGTGRVGRAPDDAMAESSFASFQTELLDREIWPTRSALKAAIFEHIEIFYNRRRRHSHLEYPSPLDHEGRATTFKSQQVDKLQAVHQSE